MARLGDVCIINPKDKIEDSELEVSFVSMQRVSENGDIDSSETRKVSEVCKGFTSFCEGDVLMAKITPCMENGKGAVARNLCNGCGFGSTEFFVIRPDQEKVLSEWLYYFTANKQFRLDCERNMTGSAGQKRVPKTYLEGCEIPVPPIEKQQEYVGNLDRISELIKMREKQIKMLDDLVKSQFIEMFGDPVENPMHWETKSLLSMGACKNGMNFHSGDSGVEINCLGVGDFKDFDVISETTNLPKVSLNEMPSEDYLLKDGDIVFVRSNGNKTMVGRSIIVFPGENPTTFSGFCIRYRNADSSILASYLLRFLKTDAIRKLMYGRGANIQNLNQQTLSSINVTVPPKKLQEQFVEFIDQADKSKFAIKQSLTELETLKSSLMQQYFG